MGRGGRKPWKDEWGHELQLWRGSFSPSLRDTTQRPWRSQEAEWATPTYQFPSYTSMQPQYADKANTAAASESSQPGGRTQGVQTLLNPARKAEQRLLRLRSTKAKITAQFEAFLHGLKRSFIKEMNKHQADTARLEQSITEAEQEQDRAFAVIRQAILGGTMAASGVDGTTQAAEGVWDQMRAHWEQSDGDLLREVMRGASDLPKAAAPRQLTAEAQALLAHFGVPQAPHTTAPTTTPTTSTVSASPMTAVPTAPQLGVELQQLLQHFGASGPPAGTPVNEPVAPRGPLGEENHYGGLDPSLFEPTSGAIPAFGGAERPPSNSVSRATISQSSYQTRYDSRRTGFGPEAGHGKGCRRTERCHGTSHKDCSSDRRRSQRSACPRCSSGHWASYGRAHGSYATLRWTRCSQAASRAATAFTTWRRRNSSHPHTRGRVRRRHGGGPLSRTLKIVRMQLACCAFRQSCFHRLVGPLESWARFVEPSSLLNPVGQCVCSDAWSDSASRQPSHPMVQLMRCTEAVRICLRPSASNVSHAPPWVLVSAVADPPVHCLSRRTAHWSCEPSILPLLVASSKTFQFCLQRRVPNSCIGGSGTATCVQRSDTSPLYSNLGFLILSSVSGPWCPYEAESRLFFQSLTAKVSYLGHIMALRALAVVIFPFSPRYEGALNTCIGSSGAGALRPLSGGTSSNNADGYARRAYSTVAVAAVAFFHSLLLLLVVAIAKALLVGVPGIRAGKGRLIWLIIAQAPSRLLLSLAVATPGAPILDWSPASPLIRRPRGHRQSSSRPFSVRPSFGARLLVFLVGFLSAPQCVWSMPTFPYDSAVRQLFREEFAQIGGSTTAGPSQDCGDAASRALARYLRRPAPTCSRAGSLYTGEVARRHSLCTARSSHSVRSPCGADRYY